MEEQLKSLYENQTWTLVENPKEKKIVGSKWVFKRKEGIPSYKNLFESSSCILLISISRYCECFCNFKSLLYRVRFEWVSLLHCIHLFFPKVKNILTICH